MNEFYNKFSQINKLKLKSIRQREQHVCWQKYILLMIFRFLNVDVKGWLNN